MNKYAHIMDRLMDFYGQKPDQHPNLRSEAQIEEVEREIGYSLPQDYREFLKEYGDLAVGTFVEIDNKAPDEPSYGGCEYFYGINPMNDSNDLRERYRNRGENCPPEFLPISAADNGAMHLVMSGSEEGRVYFWHRGQGGGDAIPENLYLVARSFDEFMHKLYLPPRR